MLKRVALARAVRGSNTIEGFTVSVEDAFAALDTQEPMDADELAWQVFVFDADNEETVYTAPEPQLVPDLVAELAAEINSAERAAAIAEPAESALRQLAGSGLLERLDPAGDPYA